MVVTTAWLCLSLVSAAPASADPAAVVLRDDEGCEDGGVVKAHPPFSVTSSVREDIAYWKPTLTVWDGADWVEYAKPRDNAAYAYILPGGINQGLNGGWRSSTTHGQLIFFPFSGLPAGEYMIYHEVVLEVDGSIVAGWSSQKCVLY